ncbi:TPA: hypothetical protein ACF3ML_001116 [Pseudomonas aeruginosa]
MSSTQHQLIEQCATRLRGIVEALDNIHDSTQHRSPHRWSTDLDDVHSSAESLLAMIKCQTADQAAQVLASPPPKCATCGGTGMVDDGEITCSEGGIPYENGPVKCVKDCPDCKAQPSPVQPEEAPVIGCLCGMPMTEGHHSPDGCSSLEEFAPHLSAQAQAKQAKQAERPEVVAYRTIGRHEKHQHPHYALNYYKQNAEDQAAHWRERGCEVSEDELMTVAQHERIVKAWIERWKAYIELSAKIAAQRDAALANVDALAVQVLKLGGTISFAHHRADQAGQVPHAWLDVQAERRRQITAEGWTPEHDDEHSHGQMARAAACYALAGSSAPNDGTAALLVSLAWPWDEQWWKPSTARRDLVKACALALAEIERLDRATATQGGPRDA